VTDKDETGEVLYRGSTVNVGAGGVYFKTLNWQDLPLGKCVHVVIDIPPEMFQLLPFGGLLGSGEIVRIDAGFPGEPAGTQTDPSSEHCGVAVRMTTRLRFDPELHLPRFEGRKKPN
jgi:hypothetical protein